MRDIPVFTTQHGVASLVLREIPYKGMALTTVVAEAKSYEEFAGARAELEAYEEAMRTQVGGEEYEAFLMSDNEVLKNLK